MAVYPGPTTVTGTVTSVNPKGLKLSPQDEWFNWSKWADDPAPPERGQAVVLTLDKAGFIRSVAPSDDAVPLPRMAGGSGGPDKDRTITRLACLKAAAEFAAGRTQLKSGEVLKIAESWERWILRSDDPGDDLEEAF